MFTGLFVAAFGLMALCVIVHAMGIASALSWMNGHPNIPLRFLRWTWFFVRLAGWIILLHGIEITIWAAFLVWQGAMPDLTSAIYFSSATYTTTGYGDIVPKGQWRLLASVEALTGILMSGWSTGFFFAFVSQMLRAEALPPVLDRGGRQ